MKKQMEEGEGGHPIVMLSELKGDRMGMTNIWRWQYTGEPVAFPETPCACSRAVQGHN